MALGGLLMTGCGSSPEIAAATRPATSGTAGHAAAIDKGIHETFTPGRGHAHLTAQQAWARFAAGARFRSHALPEHWKATLGRLSLPSSDVGPRSDWTYDARNALVWGYSSGPGLCDVSSRERRIGHNCVQWVFLSARTGRLIDKTQQTPA
jgi:hypothetical protein